MIVFLSSYEIGKHACLYKVIYVFNGTLHCKMYFYNNRKNSHTRQQKNI